MATTAAAGASAAQMLTKFHDPLRLPPVWRPERSQDASGWSWLRMRMRRAAVRLHSQLPATELWTYEGSWPGPTIEVRRGQPLVVQWTNELTGPHPVTAVVAPDTTQHEPGRSGGRALYDPAAVPAWTVVHLHGGRTPAYSDGWTENAVLPGQSAWYGYANDQRACLLWYHDLAMGISRLNVFAGLAGLYVIRDDEEDRLGLPSGPYELPLLLQDRNLDTDPDGALTGRLLHKVEDGVMEFFGPFTVVNGGIWPHQEVEPRQYRLRLANGANARTYRLVVLDERGQPVAGLLRQIGTEGGLLDRPVELPADGLVLAPAERADLLADFRGFAGQRLTVVNTAASPFDGAPAALPPGQPDPDPANKLTHPEVLEFRVGDVPVDDPFTLPDVLSSLQRLTDDQLPAGQVERVVALVEREVDGASLLTLNELEPTRSGTGIPGAPLVTITDEQGASTRYRTVATRFNDAATWFVELGATEVWKVLNLTEDTHPFHVHLVQFRLLGRDRYDSHGFDGATDTAATATFTAPGTIDDNETGWKDTVRVNPGELVAISARFDGFTGRYMYHCHLLEHEDHDMMRPYVVVPPGLPPGAATTSQGDHSAAGPGA